MGFGFNLLITYFAFTYFHIHDHVYLPLTEMIYWLFRPMVTLKEKKSLTPKIILPLISVVNNEIMICILTSKTRIICNNYYSPAANASGFPPTKVLNKFGIHSCFSCWLRLTPKKCSTCPREEASARPKVKCIFVYYPQYLCKHPTFLKVQIIK